MTALSRVLAVAATCIVGSFCSMETFARLNRIAAGQPATLPPLPPFGFDAASIWLNPLLSVAGAAGQSAAFAYRGRGPRL